MDLLIDSRTSEYNTEILLLLVKGRLQLVNDDAIYSFDDLYENFTIAFNKIKLPSSTESEVLVLGLGLGSIPYILEKCQKKIYHYTAIEIDEEIIDLAHTYSLPRLKSNVDTITADAMSFVLSTNQTFDLVTMDVFEGQLIPEQFLQLSFMEEIRDLLKPNGLFIMNTMAETPSAKEKAMSFYKDYFQYAFTNSTFIQVKGNLMLISDVASLK